LATVERGHSGPQHPSVLQGSRNGAPALKEVLLPRWLSRRRCAGWICGSLGDPGGSARLVGRRRKFCNWLELCHGAKYRFHNL